MCDLCVMFFTFVEVTSGLKVNFHKSIIVCVNINDSWLQ